MKQGWKIMDFESCIDKTKTTTKLQSSLYGEQGAFPIVSQEKELISGYWNKEENVFKHKTPIVVFGDHTKVVKYIDFDFVIGADGVKILSPKPFLNPKYFYYWVCSVQIPSRGYARHYRYLKEHQVPVPSLSEQQRIVALLDAEFAKIDALKANAEKNLQNAKDLFSSALSKELKHRDGWKETKIGEFCEIIRGKRFVRADIVEEGVPCIHYGDIYTHYGMCATKAKGCVSPVLAKKLRFANKNDVIVVAAGENRFDIGVGVAWLGDEPAVVHDACFILKHSQNPMFLSFYLRSAEYHQYLKDEVNEGKICSFLTKPLAEAKISLPPIEEQGQIVERLEIVFSNCKAMQENYKKALTLCDDLKQALLRKAFNGEI